MISVGLKAYVFTKADYNYYAVPVTPCMQDVSKGAPVTPCPTAPDPQEVMQEQQQLSSQRQQTMVEDISMLVVALPLFLYHWMIIRRKEV